MSDNPNGQIPQGKSIEQQIFEDNLNSFDEEFKRIQEKYNIIVIPALQIMPHGIIPVLNMVDKTRHEEAIKKLTGQ